jgi:predicted nucleotidyltransferase
VNLSDPLNDIVPGARGQVLAVLTQLERSVTARALARHAEVSPQAALDIAMDLAEAGLVKVDRVGRSLMIALNRKHLMADPLIAMASARARLVEQLVQELSAWKDLAGAWLFGSAARGDGGRESDIDVVLVARHSTESAQWLSATARLADLASSWSGNTLQLVEYTNATLATLIREGSALIRALREEGIELKAGSRSLLWEQA